MIAKMCGCKFLAAMTMAVVNGRSAGLDGGPKCPTSGMSWLQLQKGVSRNDGGEGCCAGFEEWPNVDGVQCPDCTALVRTGPYGGRCDRYCESFGHVCFQAAEEMSENCEVKYEARCDEPITGTSDMLCSCHRPDVASCSSSTSPAPDFSCCADFGSWPDVDDVTCDNCMALVLTAPHGGRCDRYCESFGHVCVAAAEERAESCEIQSMAKCDEPILGTSDMLCRCRRPDSDENCGGSQPTPSPQPSPSPMPNPPSPAPSPAPTPAPNPGPSPGDGCCSGFGSWPDVDGVTCDNCMALVLTAPHGGRCDRYCESFGHVCVGAAEERAESCEVDYRRGCDQAITGTSDMLCQCVKPDAPESCPAPAPTPSPTAAPRIQVRGRQLLVNGKPLHLKGIAWSPVPKGGLYPRDLDFAGYVDQDSELMARMGINVVRTYEPITDRRVLDILWSKGIWVVNSVYNFGANSASSAADPVRATKDHPAILMWSIGNEWNYNGLYVGLSFGDCIAKLRDVTDAIRAVDRDHPISSIYGDVGKLDEAVLSLPRVDVWGINVYRGISFGSLFDQYSRVSEKPMYLGEYGADAFNANIGREDGESQARATRELTEEILGQSSAVSRGPCLGGFIFEFSDEWWKDGSGSPSRHDTGGVAPGGGPYPDRTFNEEWWGLVTIDREVRPAFEAYARTDLPQASLAQQPEVKMTS
mmetsp:Transcript_26364/g.49529  ORF Transcript_26364/g.49529 Transcript_26364/m.49529 type:complete len:698 (-) Transcript_26364:151-2244(-)